MIVVATTFWVALLAILYPYVGYPAVLWLVSRLKTPGVPSRDEQSWKLPSVTLIISAYNEEKVIAEKLKNALALDFPHELLEIVVLSDGSTDQTCEIVLQFAHHGIVLRHFKGRIGKTACLNRALPLAKGQIVVFSDANSRYSVGALKALVHPFSRSDVGFVTGWTKYASSDGVGNDSLKLYSRIELITKELESHVGSCVGADGAIFAIRKELYLPLNDYDINDLVIPLSINQQGFRGVLQRNALCFETDAGGAKGEFHRQVRITNRTIRAIVNYRHLLNPFRFGLLSFELFSHKVCKFLVPLFMVLLLLTSLILAGHGAMFVMLLIAQGAFYLAAGAALIVPNGSVLSRICEAAKTFVLVNAAIALAWIMYLQGETYTMWSPTRR